MRKRKVSLVMVAIFFFLAGATMASALQINLDVLKEYEQVQAGEELKFEVVIKDIETSARHDVTLDYYVRQDGKLIAHAKEVKAVATQTSFIGTIDIPEDTPSGIYEIEIIANGKVMSSDYFYVIISKMAQIEAYLIMILISVITVGIVLWWEIRKFMHKTVRRKLR